MESIKVSSQRIFYAVAIFIMAVALVLPAIASAAQVTSRSVALSSSSVEATNVTYSLKFTPATDAGAFVVDFCENTPLIGQACDAATGFTAAGAATSSAGFTIASAAAQRLVVTGDMTASTPVEVEFTKLTNPDEAGTLYARIVTFADGTAASASTPTNVSGSIDEGGVAIAITDTIGVSGVVLETLTFCVSGDEITVDCGATTAPTVALGDTLAGSDLTVLTPGVLETGDIYTQITTNAVGGAVVRLKSNAAECGGMLRAGDPAGECHIEPALTGGVTAANNEARFGVKTATATSYNTATVTNANGVLVPGNGYNETTYVMNWEETEATGVTSPFGDVFLNTAGEPANNQNMQLNFAATVSNNTPAGAYYADISLIAVGTF